MNLAEWGLSVKVAPNEVEFASTWLWSSFRNLWRAYKIVVGTYATTYVVVHSYATKFTPRVYSEGVSRW